MMRQLNLSLSAMLEGIKAFGAPGVWVPILVFMVIQLGVLWGLTHFHHPLLAGILIPFIRLTVGEGAIHYPGFYAALPTTFNVINLALALTVGAYLWGVATSAVAAQHDEAHGGGWSPTVPRWGALIVTQLPVVLLAAVFTFVPRYIFADMDLGGNALRALLYGPPVVFAVWQSMFLFGPAAVLVEGRSGLDAIGRSLAVWRRSFLSAILMVGILSFILHFPLQYFLRDRPAIISKFSPETIALLMGSDHLCFFFTNVVLVTAATITFLVGRREVHA
jgi:hypothetical protein